MTVTFDGWVVEVDVEATRRAYAQTKAGYARSCSCLNCRNFVAARDRNLVFPADALALFERMGIDSSCEAEVFIAGSLDDTPGTMATYRYSGWFNLVGALIADHGGQAEWTGRDQFRVWACADGQCLSHPFRGQPTCRFEFDVLVPWLLPPEEGVPF